MITRDYIFDKANFLLKKENKFFTSTEVMTLIAVDAFRRLAEDLDFPKVSYSSYMTSGQYSLSTPSDFIKIDENSEVTYQHDGTTVGVLDPKKVREIGMANILTATPGTPENYYMKTESEVGVYPPSTSGCLVIPYVKTPVALSTGTATNELTENCYMAAVYWTVFQCMMKDNDARKADYITLYEKEILRLRKRFGDMWEIDYDIKPHDGYLQHET